MKGASTHPFRLPTFCLLTLVPVVIQRVKSASVTVDQELVSSIGRGLLVLAGVGKEDTEKDAEGLVNKLLKSRFWPDENGAQVRPIDSHIVAIC